MQIVSNPNCQLNDCFTNRINLPNNVNMDFINLVSPSVQVVPHFCLILDFR